MFVYQSNLVAVRDVTAAVCLLVLAGCSATNTVDQPVTAAAAQSSSAQSSSAQSSSAQSSSAQSSSAQSSSAQSSSAQSSSASASVPTAPTGLTAIAGNAQVSLTWKASSGVTGYYVKRSTANGGPFSQVGAPSASATSFTDLSLSNGTTYYYVVTATNSAGESANSASVSATPVASVASCSSSGSTNAWENASSGMPGSAFAFAIDPRHPGTIYVGTSGGQGIWKTTNCGATWTGPINTGYSFTGMIWALTIDPVTSELYATDGYGKLGLLKSTDGGVNWTQLLPQSILSATGNGFVNHISIDPTNHLHVVADFHVFQCTGTAPAGAPIVQNNDYQNPVIVSYLQSVATGSGTNTGWGCLAETYDGGANWSLKAAPVPWGGADGPGITVIDDKTWFFGQQSGKLWRTTTGGVATNNQPAWTQVNIYTSCSGGGVCTQPMSGSTGFVYQAIDGSFYSGGNYALVHSTDGMNWTQISDPYSPSIYDYNGLSNIVDTGTTLIASRNASSDYYTGSISAINSYTGKTPTQLMTRMSTTSSGGGRQLAYDSVNHFVYASGGGFWRLKTQ